MRRCLAVLIPMMLAMGAAPVAAQPAVHQLAQREARLQGRIDESVAKGRIDESQGLRLRDRLRRIRKLEAYYRSRRGFSAWERRDIERRLNALSARLAADGRAAHRRQVRS